MTATDLRSLSVQDYRRMVEAGILAADERVELIEGQLYTMAAKGTAHSAAVTRIEVADSTLRRDRDLKVPMYGRSGIAEYWFLEVQERCLYVFRQPEAGGYGMEQKLYEGDAIAPLAFPDCEIAVREFLRSGEQR
jgi:Uma2 family endonuclease